MEFLNNRFVIALLVPGLLFLAGGIGKKLVRGKPWERKDWYLGVDAALAAMSAAVINIFEATRMKKLVPIQSDLYDGQQIASAVFIVISFFIFLYLLGIHQDWESQAGNTKGQNIWLLGVSNFIGLGLMFAFILAVKGVE